MFRAVIVLALLFALPASAGTPQERRKWWMGQSARELGLTSDQSSRIDAIYQSAVPRIATAQQDFEDAQKELNALIAGDKTTETDVIRQLVQVQAARSEASRQFTLMLYRFYRELSPEQRVKVRAMFDRREQQRRDGRRDQPPQRKTIKK